MVKLPLTPFSSPQLDLSNVTVVGASMGCAVIWSYVELFGQDRLKQVLKSSWFTALVTLL